jgi:hypothetical protein
LLRVFKRLAAQKQLAADIHKSGCAKKQLAANIHESGRAKKNSLPLSGADVG